jgi:hypothetical protein
VIGYPLLMTIIAIIAAAVAVIMAVVMAVAAHRAPEGYQDEDGFHYGIEPPPEWAAGWHQIRSMDDFQAHERESHARRSDAMPREGSG